MPHHIYQTEGFVLRSLPEGEASKYIEIFTRELGLVGAHARSVRAERSKLRYALQDYATADISLVRGRHGWKVVNAIPKVNYFAELRANTAKLSSFVRIARLLRKLVVGEERNEKLYEAFLGSIEFLVSEKADKGDMPAVQIIAALRILHHLGYGVEHSELREIAETLSWGTTTLRRAAEHRAEAEQLIRASLSVTQL